MSELRWHPFLREWVVLASHRQDRTFHPPPDFCPLCPTRPGGFETEVPRETYDVAVFENRFPAFDARAAAPDSPGSSLSPVAAGAGVCEVVCYSPDHDASLSTLPLSQVRKLTRVWRHRTVELGARADVRYVLAFENRGREIGVTLSHPHGQVYGFPFVPPVPARELAAEREHFEATGRSLVQDWLAEERASGERTVWENDRFCAVVPTFARWPFETYVVPKRHLPSLAETTWADLDALAEAVHVVSRSLDGLHGRPMPSMMVVHQAPTEPGHEYACLHVEFYPALRTSHRLKYLAGCESGAGTFILDVPPEDAAARLRDLATSSNPGR